jgi:methyl-accepting chemotaxis protein PixJ
MGNVKLRNPHVLGEQMTAIDSTPPSPHQLTQRLRLRSKSIGSRLFSYIIGGALVGLAGTGWLFYQTLEKRATGQIRDILKTEVNSIEGKLEGTKFFSRGLGSAVNFTRNAGTTKAEAFNPLVLDFFLKRPELAMAAFFVQKPYGIATDRQWYAPYFYLDQKADGQIGARLSAPNDNIIYSELFTDDRYPTQSYYKTAISAQKDIWIEPYLWYGVTMTSFYTPILDQKGQMSAFAGVDVNVTELSKAVQPSVFENAGYFVLLSQQGNLLSYPPDPAKAKGIESYAKVSSLQEIWPKLKASKSGILHERGNYWIYQRIPSNQWFMLAVVPESVVVGPALGITLTGTVGAALILAIVVTLFVRWLNRRLEPILEECNKLAQTDEQTQQMLSSQDEIGQLSSAFFNVVTQLSEKQEQIQREADLRVQLEEQQRQMIEAESRALQNDVGMLLDTVAAVEDGDLTIQAPVSDRATGLVADTLNRLVEDLGRIMTTVASTTQQVSQTVNVLESQATATTQQAQIQASSVDQVQNLMTNVTELAHDTLQQTLLSDEAVQQAKQAVAQGNQEILGMTQGINVLQDGTQQIVRRVQTLSDFVNLAAQFSQDQKRVAAMTRVLALNASMVASRASGEQDPEQFAVVAHEFEAIAEQVNELAVQTNQGLQILLQRTNQIQTVVSGISLDVEEISDQVLHFGQGVSQSRQLFEEIKTVTERVAQVGQQVTHSSQAIVEATQMTLESVQDIAAISLATEQQSQSTLAQANALEQLSQTLQERISFFRLPEAPAETVKP